MSFSVGGLPYFICIDFNLRTPKRKVVLFNGTVRFMGNYVIWLLPGSLPELVSRRLRPVIYSYAKQPLEEPSK